MSRYSEIIMEINNKYKDKYIIYLLPKNETPYTIIGTNRIYFPLDRFLSPDSRDIFDLLHEIGHQVTNTIDMEDWELEYYATEWAIKEIKKYDVVINIKDKKIYDKYINSFEKKGIVLNW